MPILRRRVFEPVLQQCWGFYGRRFYSSAEGLCVVLIARSAYHPYPQMPVAFVAASSQIVLPGLPLLYSDIFCILVSNPNAVPGTPPFWRQDEWHFWYPIIKDMDLMMLLMVRSGFAHGFVRASFFASGPKIVLIKRTFLLACVRRLWRGGVGWGGVNVPCASSATCCYAAQMSGSAASLYTWRGGMEWAC